MKKLLIAALLCVAPLLSQATDWIWSNKDIAVVVSDNKACTNKRILKEIELLKAPPELVWAEAKILYEAKVIPACAAVVGPRVVFIDEEGAGGTVPQQGFHKLRDA